MRKLERKKKWLRLRSSLPQCSHAFISLGCKGKRQGVSASVRAVPVMHPSDVMNTPMKRTHEEAFPFFDENASVTESVVSSAARVEPDKAGNAARTISKLK